ncbi:carbamate kinase [bacterium]|nr:carbamate kinase [bacterium]
MIGYVLEQELMNCATAKTFATLLTQILVDPDDPAFKHPSKPIGPLYNLPDAETLKRTRQWTMAAEGEHWRRVVASPLPSKILALAAIQQLSAAGMTVICAGGGGIPVVKNPDGLLAGVEAVIDKDLASALLAIELDADALLLLTDVSAVMTDFGTPDQRAICRTGPKKLRDFNFAPGSMGPKVAAAIAMAERGKRAAIGSMADAQAIVLGTAGTWVEPDQTAASIAWW